MISVADYYRKHIHNLIKSYDVLLNSYAEEGVYNLRIAYKRIRAVNKFLKKELNCVLFNDQNDKLVSIYKGAGTIREIQTNLKLLSKYDKVLDKSFDEFAVFLNDKMAEINSQLRAYIKETDIDNVKRVENKIYHHLSGISEKNIYIKCILFIKRKNRKIDTLVFDKTNKERYHDIRTCIKEILFFLKLLYSKKEFEKVSFKSHYLKNIGINLGNWHDNEILLNDLHNFLIDKTAIYDKSDSKFEELIKHITKEQNKRIKNIDRKIIKTNLDLVDFIGKKEIELV